MGDGVTGRVRHLILARLSDDAQEAQVQVIAAELGGLVDKIEGIESFEMGGNISPEGRNRGFTHALMFTFVGPAARDAYLRHPEHARVAERITELGIIEDLLVIDYAPLQARPARTAP